MINIMYAALSIRVQTEKTTFSCKDDCTLTKHTGRWTYPARDYEIPLCHIPPLRSFFLEERILQSVILVASMHLIQKGFRILTNLKGVLQYTK